MPRLASEATRSKALELARDALKFFSIKEEYQEFDSNLNNWKLQTGYKYDNVPENEHEQLEQYQFGEIDADVNRLNVLGDYKFPASGKVDPQDAATMEMQLKTLCDYLKGHRVDPTSTTPFDYEEWEQNASLTARLLSHKLDEYNKATDFEFINNPEMIAISTLVDHVISIDIQMKHLESQELIDGLERTVDEYFNERIKLSNDITEIKQYCNDNDIDMSKISENSKTAEQAVKEFQNAISYYNDIVLGTNSDVEAEVRNFPNMQSPEAQKYKYAAGLLENLENLKFHNDEISFYKEQNQKAKEEYNDKLGEIEMDDDLYNAFIARGKLLETLGLRKKVPTDEAGLEAFKKQFIENDPVGAFYIDGEPTEDDIKEQEQYRDKINKMTSTEMQKYCETLMDGYNDIIINGCDTELTQKFNNYDILFNKNLIENNSKIAKHEAQKKETEKNIVSEQKKIVNYLNEYSKQHPEKIFNKDSVDLINDVNRLCKNGVITKKNVENKIQKGNAKALSEIGSEKGKLFSEKFRRLDEAIDLTCKNKGELEVFAQSLNKADIKLENVKRQEEKVNRAYNKLKESESKYDPINADQGMLKQRLNRYYDQLGLCKRAGHSDTSEFKAMRDAVDNLRKKKNITADDLSQLSRTAKEYLTAKKGGQKLFKTKMRTHRLELAKSLEKFGAEGAKLINNTTDREREIKQSAQSGVKIDRISLEKAAAKQSAFQKAEAEENFNRKVVELAKINKTLVEGFKKYDNNIEKQIEDIDKARKIPDKQPVQKVNKKGVNRVKKSF